VRDKAIAVGLFLGLALGGAAAATGMPALRTAAEWLEPVGTAFVNLVRMVVVPLVAATVFTGVVRLGDPRALGRLGGATLVFFVGTMVVAIAVGMAVMALAVRFVPDVTPPGGAERLEQLPGTVDFLLGLIPTNPIEVAARGALLPLVVFSVLFGAAASTLSGGDRERLTGLADAIGRSMVQLANWVLWTAPIGVLALAASTMARSGWSMLQSLAIFVGAVLVALVAFVATVYLPAIRIGGRAEPWEVLRAALPAMAIGASATSSAAALPAMFEVAERKLRLSPGVAAFVLSLGAAINRSGSALFQGAAIVFLASLYDVSLTGAAIGIAILGTLLVSMTVPGVPSASLVTLAPVLGSLGVPTAGLALLLGVDRIPDMARTAVHVLGHLTAAIVVQRTVSSDR
jgi:Na+/H+-dicarboxylate symporter